MKLTQEQQKKVEQNMRLVGKVIKDKVHGTNQLLSIHMMILCRLVILDYVKQPIQIRVDVFRLMHTDSFGMRYPMR